MKNELLIFSPRGIYCPVGDFFIDPWKPVKKALITHAHADHSRWGMQHYLAHHDSIPIMKHRLGQEISVLGVAYGEKVEINGVKVSFHPAGHIIGSAQIRVEYQGEVWVASGDYKVEDDGLATPFEAIPCHAFISETTFGLPVYRWAPQQQVMAEINDWWAENARQGRASLIMAYALGKAQRILQQVDHQIGTVFTHGAVENVNEAFRAHGIDLKASERITAQHKKKDLAGGLVIAPGSAIGTPWARKLGNYSLGIASGWMSLRGARRRRAADRGFVLSDHADWQGLNQAIKATGAERVYLTHGYTEQFARWLHSQGYEAYVEQTRYGEEEE
jgi:putative mRNA 3-end processing factor